MHINIRLPLQILYSYIDKIEIFIVVVILFFERKTCGYFCYYSDKVETWYIDRYKYSIFIWDRYEKEKKIKTTTTKLVVS